MPAALFWCLILSVWILICRSITFSIKTSNFISQYRCVWTNWCQLINRTSITVRDSAYGNAVGYLKITYSTREFLLFLRWLPTAIHCFISTSFYLLFKAKTHRTKNGRWGGEVVFYLSFTSNFREKKTVGDWNHTKVAWNRLQFVEKRSEWLNSFPTLPYFLSFQHQKKEIL